MAKYSVGDIAYILESGRFIREGKIMRISGGIYLFQFTEGGAIQVKEHRLFESEESVQKGSYPPTGEKSKIPLGSRNLIWLGKTAVPYL